MTLFFNFIVGKGFEIQDIAGGVLIVNVGYAYLLFCVFWILFLYGLIKGMGLFFPLLVS